MKIVLSVFLVLLTGCGNAADALFDVACQITFNNPDACEFQETKVSVSTEALASDEKKLLRLNVQHKGKSYLLKITPVFAISTSFGLANQFLDYWVFNKSKEDYIFIGNHARFSLNKKSKTLTNEVKAGAANYDKSVFVWERGLLMPVNK